MDDNNKELLKQIKLLISDVEVMQDRRAEAVEKNLASLSNDINSWRPQLESRVEELRTAVTALQRQAANKAVAGVTPMPADGDPAAAHLAGTRASVASTPLLGKPPAGSDLGLGHGNLLLHRGAAAGIGSIPGPTPVTGMINFQTPIHMRSNFSELECSANQVFSQLGQANPSLQFPVFDGDNPQMWQTLAEQYFTMFSIHQSYWVPMATLNFAGSPKVWLHSVRKKLGSLDWSSFCALLCTRFGRDRHQMLIRQFYILKQHDTVTDYIERFETLMNNLLAYSDAIHPLYFLTRFIEGLRSDIRAVVMVQRPQDLDAACALALLQEEVADSIKPTNYRFQEYPYRGRPLPLPLPPARVAPNVMAQDRRCQEAARGKGDHVSKLTALKNYRRARGLCFKCGEKWGQDHACPATIQLHVVEELFEMMGADALGLNDDHSDAMQELETLCTISVHALSEKLSDTEGTPSVLQLQGWIQGHAVTMLVDSGSTTSFMNMKLQQTMQNVTALLSPVKVKVADDRRLRCTEEIRSCAWTSQGQTFSTDFKFLQLGAFDVILGQDWLYKHSPMYIDWPTKRLEISDNGKTVFLQGVGHAEVICQRISVEQLSGLHRKGDIEQVLVIQAADTGKQQVTAVSPEVQAILDKFQDVFDEPAGLPPRRACDHPIQLIDGAQPVQIRPYRHSPATKDEIERQVKELLKSGVIQNSTSAFASPAILVQKKDLTWRLCIDYRRFNAMNVPRKFPVPVIDELIDDLTGARWFSKLDLRAGYHQIRLAPGEEHKTAFYTHSGHYEYKVMSFGLSGAPATFQAAMNATLQSVLRKCALVFFDDILVYSTNLQQHLFDLSVVLSLLRKDKWQVKLSKCSFAQQSLAYLGHIISGEGVATDPSKVQEVLKWKVPTNVKELRGLLGLAGNYRKFVRHFGIIARPLTQLLKKNTIFKWNSVADKAFSVLKNALVSAPVLAIPDFNKVFVVETDASDLGIGAVLHQQGHPIAYLSKPLGPRTSGLSTYEKEYLAILLAVEQWRSYLQHDEFVIRTDQHSLVHLEEQRLSTPWQRKAFSKLLGLRYQIVYRRGRENAAADALSRKVHEQVLSVAAISVCQPAWLADVSTGYSDDVEAQKLLLELATSTEPTNYTLDNGIIKHKGRVWIGNNLAMQHKIFQAFHSSSLGGHSGAPVTYIRIKKLFMWSGMKKFIKQKVRCCQVCQQAKPERVKYPGLLEPLRVPGRPWQHIAMDFIEGLPQSGQYNCLLVVVDRFSKYGHFIPLAHPYTAAKVASLFVDFVFKLHSLPESIVSDRDPVFTSHFWRDLFKVVGTQLNMSTAYHPASDGQTERVNQCVETYLRCFVHACPRKWSKWISLAEYWYNTSHHSTLNSSPFVVLYGHEPRHWGIEAPDSCSVSNLQSWLTERRVVHDLLRQHLLRAQQIMKKQADKNRTFRQFQVMYMVFLKLQPYIQASVAPRANHKLLFKYFGPFRVTAKISDTAYRLALPEGSTIHPVFHMSLLRQALAEGMSSSPVLPHDTDSLAIPVKVLAKMWRKKANGVVEQALIQWSPGDAASATWEDREHIQGCFPLAPAWGQAGSKGGGGVRVPGEGEVHNSRATGLDTSAPEEPRRSSRPSKPNAKYSGPSWVH